MKKSYRFLVSFLLLGAYLLSACTGVIPQVDDSPQGPSGSSQSTEAVFTGTVEAIGGTQWLISGQQVNVDSSTSVDSNIKVGDIVKVDANVSADGIVLAVRIEGSRPDSLGANDNSANGNSNDANANDDNANTNDNTNADDNSNGNVNSNDNNSNAAPSGTEQETLGVVEAITTDSITINGVTYSIASFTEFKTLISVGDQVKIHVIVNADGTFTIREIEKSTGTGIGDDNSNSNFNGNDNGNDDNSNSNSNDNDDHDDDKSNGNSNGNSNDDDKKDDNGNDSNSNDD